VNIQNNKDHSITHEVSFFSFLFYFGGRELGKRGSNNQFNFRTKKKKRKKENLVHVNCMPKTPLQ
jgi:hypothetical protein